MSITEACAAFLAIALILSRPAYRTLWSPPVICFAVFLASVLTFDAITGPKLPVLQASLIPESKELLILGWLGLFLGFFTIPAIKRFRFHPENPSRRDLRLLRQWAKLMLGLSVSCDALLLSIIWRSFGNPLMSAEAAREAMTVGKLFSLWETVLFHSSFVAIADWTILAVYGDRKDWKIVAALVGLTILVANAGGSGGWIFSSLMLFGAVYLLSTLHRYGGLPSKKTVVPLSGVCLLLLLLTLNAYAREQNDLTLVETIVLHDGVYLGGTIAALDDAVRKPIPSPYPGYNLFPAVFRTVNEVSRLLLATEQFTNVEINHRFDIGLALDNGGFFNSAPVMAWIYSELGPVGSVVGCFIIGAFASWAFLTATCGGQILAFETGGMILLALALTYRSSFLDDPYMNAWLMACLGRELLVRTRGASA